MASLKKAVAATPAVAALLLCAGVSAVWMRPPELIRIGAGYTAKTICSNTFLAGRDPIEVLASDVQAPGHPLLKYMRIDVDRARGVVRAGLLGFIGNGLAIARPGVGCAVVTDGKLAIESAFSDPLPSARSSLAEADADETANVAAMQRVIEDDELSGPGMRAIVVVQDGRIVAERYSSGFDRNTPQLGWSMAKSVTAGLIGLLVKDGRLSLTQGAGWPPDDERSRITIADLLSMSSGLQFDEGYAAVSDMTRMLYLESDMAAFARDKPVIHPPGSVWSYSSGTAVILSRIFQDAVGDGVISFMRTRLFEPLGMGSAVMETDARGTLVGCSYMYATPRDWARYGQLLAQDGVWQGQEILPRGYVAMMASPVTASGGDYGRGMLWRRIAQEQRPGEVADARLKLPEDTFWMSGHDGQYVAVIPSRRLVIVRMGLTPGRIRYRPQALVHALIEVVPQASP